MDRKACTLGMAPDSAFTQHAPTLTTVREIARPKLTALRQFGLLSTATLQIP